MTKEELRNKPIEEVSSYLESSLKDLFALRMRHCLRQLENPNELKKMRRKVAVIKTILHERRV
jgi:large subunit ribosomal protein L29